MIRNRRLAALFHGIVAVLLLVVWLWPGSATGCAAWGQTTASDGHCVLARTQTECERDQAVHEDGHCLPCPYDVPEGDACFSLIGDEL
ncbi:MAG: hypothetical protein GY720_19300 [bacterium]|nr:hypothetical protein [bacterium]